MLRVTQAFFLVVALLATYDRCFAQHPLPGDMVADYSGWRTFAEQWWLPVTGSGDEVYGRITFDNSGPAGSVSIKWWVTSAGAAVRSYSQDIGLSFRPTAVARRAGTSNTLYVVGWSERTGRVIVEVWTFAQYAVGSTMPQGGSAAISTFILPEISRVVDWISEAEAIAPIWDAVCSVEADALLLLESGPVTKIMSLDLSSRSISTMYSSSTTGIEALQGHRMFSAGRPQSGGFVCFTEHRRPWESGTSYSEPYTLFVLKDGEGDGHFESTAFLTNAAFWALYPIPWNMQYPG